MGDSPLRWVLQIGRWLVLVLLVITALAVLYRLAPDPAAPKMRWVSVGAVVATILWLVASIGFSLYVSTFGNYAKTCQVAVVARVNDNRARAKSGRHRFIPARDELMRLYADYVNREYQALDSDYVFVNLWGRRRGIH